MVVALCFKQDGRKVAHFYFLYVLSISWVPIGATIAKPLSELTSRVDYVDRVKFGAESCPIVASESMNAGS